MRAAASCIAVPPDKRGTPVEPGGCRSRTGVAYGWCHSAWMQFLRAGGGTTSKANGPRMCASRSTHSPPQRRGPPLKRRKPGLPPSRQHSHLRWFIHSPQSQTSGCFMTETRVNHRISAPNGTLWWMAERRNELSTKHPADFGQWNRPLLALEATSICIG